ncbi:adenylate cyclase [Cohnella sp. CIP 111063]|jgi:adenylate cyclase|uniref:CYTH domain-containing protein n=1 Tax=unclassified Cohnella TaxID=2636738 RepID=UPI000B8BC8C2|nr:MULTISPECIES: CYTH domain-containing protein [unclassified Cohnella]OXS52456.1 adenylate cyclase [Cohnella sp. CIP 111063]PRX58508.1 CYTH domain-containing protein [Cohnella sp. SGD-V74]
MAKEIERKFLMTEFPDTLVREGELVLIKEQRIEQTYLAMDDTQELRVRKIKDLASGEHEFTHTFKRGNGLVREEIEYSISESLYEQLIQASGAIPLTKIRTTADWSGTTVEIDTYDQVELRVLEVEFESEEEAESFRAPGWFGPDISSTKQYSNKTVWRNLQAGLAK